MKKRRTRLISFMLITSISLVMIMSGCKGSDYSNAQSLLDSGSYEKAAEAFSALGNYKDGAEKAKEAQVKLEKQRKTEKYNKAIQCLDDGNLEEAKSLFKELGDFEEAASKIFKVLSVGDTNTYNNVEWKVTNITYSKDGKKCIKLVSTHPVAELFDVNENVINDAYLNSKFLLTFPDKFQKCVLFSDSGKEISREKENEFYLRVFFVDEKYEQFYMKDIFYLGAVDEGLTKEEGEKYYISMWIDTSMI